MKMHLGLKQRLKSASNIKQLELLMDAVHCAMRDQMSEHTRRACNKAYYARYKELLENH